MKNIEIDDELYQYIVTQTQFIGENASSILRRLLKFSGEKITTNTVNTTVEAVAKAVKVETKAVVIEAVSNKSKDVLSDGIARNTISADVTDKITTKVAIKESVFNFINKEELAMQRGAVGRFLLILGALYRAHSDGFYVVNDICGRDRLYFASSEQALEESGSSTKPRQIAQSPYWVITNSNTTRKKMILTKVATFLGYQESDVEKIRELL